MIQRKLRIQGMSCEHCVQRVEEALKGLPGVAQVRVSLEEGLATVELSSEGASMGQLLGAVERAGYQAEELSES